MNFNELKFKSPNYERDQNGSPISLYCVECVNKDIKKIGVFILNGNSICEECFENKK